MAVLAALIFSWTSVLFTRAGQRLGVTLVNLLRLPGAALCLTAAHLVVHGRARPADVAPVVTVVLAWVLLAEHLGLAAVAGIAVVISGVMLATLGRHAHAGRFAAPAPDVLRAGLWLAVLAAVGQGAGAVLAKLGMTGGDGSGVDPLGGTLLRLVWAAAGYWLAVVPRLDLGTHWARLRDHRGVVALAAAILLGPFLSVWISLVAIKNTEAGVAHVLSSLVPVFVV